MRLIIFQFLFVMLSICCKAQSNELNDIQLIDENEISYFPFQHSKHYSLVLPYSIFCGSCIHEMEIYSKLYIEWKEKYNTEIIVINTDSYQSYENRIKRKIKNSEFSFKTYIDKDGSFANFLAMLNGYDKNSFLVEKNGKYRLIVPQTIIIDRNGKILKQIKGYKNGYENQIEEFLSKINDNSQ